MHTISPYIKVSSMYLLIAMPMPLHTSSFAHMWSWKPCDCDAQTVYDHFCLPLLTDMRVIFVADSGVFSRLGWGWSVRTPGTPGCRWSARRVRPVGPLRCSSGRFKGPHGTFAACGRARLNDAAWHVNNQNRLVEAVRPVCRCPRGCVVVSSRSVAMLSIKPCATAPAAIVGVLIS